MTTEQLDSHLKWETEYHDQMEREYRRQWWRTLPTRLWQRFWEPFKRNKVTPDDDDIPF